MKRALNAARLLVLIGMFSLGGVTLSACNTVEGIGEDISAASRAVRDAFDGD